MANFPCRVHSVFFHAVSLRIGPHVGLNEEKLSMYQHIFNVRHISISLTVDTHTGTCVVQTNIKGRTEK